VVPARARGEVPWRASGQRVGASPVVAIAWPRMALRGTGEKCQIRVNRAVRDVDIVHRNEGCARGALDFPTIISFYIQREPLMIEARGMAYRTAISLLRDPAGSRRAVSTGVRSWLEGAPGW
jgi:hypothetical protein